MNLHEMFVFWFISFYATKKNECTTNTDINILLITLKCCLYNGKLCLYSFLQIENLGSWIMSYRKYGPLPWI